MLTDYVVLVEVERFPRKACMIDSQHMDDKPAAEDRMKQICSEGQYAFIEAVHLEPGQEFSVSKLSSFYTVIG